MENIYEIDVSSLTIDDEQDTEEGESNVLVPESRPAKTKPIHPKAMQAMVNSLHAASEAFDAPSDSDEEDAAKPPNHQQVSPDRRADLRYNLLKKSVRTPTKYDFVAEPKKIKTRSQEPEKKYMNSKNYVTLMFEDWPDPRLPHIHASPRHNKTYEYNATGLDDPLFKLQLAGLEQATTRKRVK